MATNFKPYESCESDDEEEEPKLKYERIDGDLKDILKKDGASCMFVTDKLLIIGSNWGKIHVLDHLGNRIRQFNNHSGPVTMVDMDDQGDYLASCSHDKKVIIQELYSNEPCHTVNLDAPIRCVAIEPSYSKSKSKKRFIVGTNQLIMYEKALFGAVKPSFLYEASQNNCEIVRNMHWGGQFLAFAVDSAVRVIDMDTKAVISLIKRDHSLAMTCDQYPPHICWQDERTLLIGWGDSVKVCRVRDRSAGTASELDLPPYYVEIAFMFTTDFYVCGIGPLDKLVVILAYNKSCNTEQVSSNEWRRPQMRVVLPLQKTYEELSKDVLGIRGYQSYQPFNYHLKHLGEDRRFYIVCPQDVVVAKPREPQDRIQWLLEHERFQEALELVENCGGKVSHFTTLNVGQNYIEHLIEEKKFKKAAQLAPKVAGDDRMLWELVIDRFHSLGQLKELSLLVPTGPPGPLLSTAIYQTVLADLLKKDHQTFLEVVKMWPKTLYNVAMVINDVLNLQVQERNSSNTTLLRALAHLYSNIEKHDKALAIYLKLQHKDVFGLIKRHSLFYCVSKHINELMSLDAATTLQMCSLHISIIDPTSVVQSLANSQQFLYKYLDMLYEEQKEYSIPFHNRLIQLYAIHDKTKIMPLLMSSAHIDLDPALNVVQTFCLIPETVYLLIRMGSSEKALRIVLQEENDLRWAIKICQQHSDHDLWKVLIEHSLDKPEYIRELLNNMGAHVDPLLILQRIPDNLKIPGLRDALTKILHDYELKITLQNGYQEILIGDCIKLLQKQLNIQSSGISIRREGECCLCQQKLINSKMNEDYEIMVFNCKHIYHSKCFSSEQPDFDLCVVCTSKKVVPCPSG